MHAKQKLISLSLFAGSWFALYAPALGGSDQPAPPPPAGQILWWVDLAAPSFGSSAVGDLDRDGKPEIVFGTYFNGERVHALNAEDGSTLWSYPTNGCNDASPLIVDVDQDGELEVIVPCSSTCRVFCFDGASGTIEWTKLTASNSIDSPPAVADLDGDGKLEVVFGTFYGHVYCVNGEDGSACWHINLGSGSFIQSAPAVLDVDGDGQLDVVVAEWMGNERVYALRGNDGATLWYTDTPNDWMYHGASFADLDEDGRPELVIGCYDSKVYAFNAEDGSDLWSFSTPFYAGAPTSIADLDGDEHLEVFYAAHDRVGVLNHDGSALWSKNHGGSVFRGAAIADVDANGVLDVVYGGGNGVLSARRGNDGALLFNSNLGAHYGNTFDMDNAPVVADFDGDGYLDIFVVGGYATSSNPSQNHGRAYALTAGAGDGEGWLCFRHDARRSGSLVDSSEDPGTGYCFGDPGSGTPCPCSNDNDGSVPGSGCDNGVFASGALLTGTGTASVSYDTLTLSATGLEPSNTGLYFQADNAIAGGAGTAFGDGLRCAGGALIRLQVRFADATGESSTTVDVATKGAVSAGDTRRYQLWYRTTTNPPCGVGVNDFNLTNGYEIDWLP